MALVTPYVYGKQHNIRPQMVYQWCTKQDCPHKKIGGKIYVESAAVDKWLKDRKTQKAQKVTKAKEIDEARRELGDLLLKQKPKVSKGWCVQCGKETTFHQNIQYTDGDLFGQYVSNCCTDCGYCCYHTITERVQAYELLKGIAEHPFPPDCCPNPHATAQMHPGKEEL